jgi:hypothetical protein
MLLTSYMGDKIKEPEMGRTYNTSGGEGKCLQSFGGDIWLKETTRKTSA